MRLNNVLVADLDGTLTNGGEDLVKPHVKESLLSIKSRGWTLILATGRDRKYLMRRADLRGIFDAWVAEAGLSIYLPKTGISRCFADEYWRIMVKKLTTFPFVEEKENTVVFRFEYLDTVKAEIIKLGINAVLKDNKGTVIPLPEGVNKALGVKEALKLLNVDGPIVAVGDAKLDLELFEIAAFRAAVANAEQSLKEKAEYVANRENGEGVMEIIQAILKGWFIEGPNRTKKI
ncbi:MAG: HAD hydrolase family protein [Candidatus Bathyarchaeia archaeon]